MARFNRRGETAPDDPWHSQVQAIVTAQGGDDALRQRHSALQALPDQRPDAMLIQSVEGDIEATYQRLVGSLA